MNYSSVTKAIYASTTESSRSFAKPLELVREVAKVVFKVGGDAVRSVRIEVDLPRAVLMAQSVAYSASSEIGDDEVEGKVWSCEIRDLRLSCLIGLHEHERREKQRLGVDVEVQGFDQEVWNHRAFTNEVVEVCRSIPLVSEKASLTGTKVLGDQLFGHA